MPPARDRTRGGPRRLLVALATGALFLAFLAARFPYERLLPALGANLAAATGAEVQVETLGLGLGFGGPELVARGLVLHWPGSEPLPLDALALRPAWSLDWLRGRPRWHVAASGPPGAFSGALALDRIAGRLDELELPALPWAQLGATSPLQGRISGRIDLVATAESWVGWIDLSGNHGSVDLAALPVAIPYERLAARVELGPGQLELSQARLEGPLVTARFAGSALPNAGAFAGWPLELQVEIERLDPALASYLGPLGIRLDRDGRSRLRVTGTLSAPVLAGATP